jgi:Trimethylamine:corrinoid methyltransferase
LSDLRLNTKFYESFRYRTAIGINLAIYKSQAVKAYSNNKERRMKMSRNAQASFTQMGSFGVNVFSQDELYSIHCATLDVLQHVGVRVNSKKAQEIFSAGGATVDPKSEIVKIPPYVVEEAIHSAPRTILLASRDPKKDYILESKRVGFVNFGEGTNVIDPVTRKYRPSKKQDVADAAKMSDYLSEMDISYRAVVAQDCPGPAQALHNAQAIFPNTSKHFFIGADGVRNARKLIDMAAAVAGGRDQLKERPLISFNVCPTSLLKLIPECTDVVIEAAQAGIPVNIISMAMAGATSPVTLAGTLVTHNAEVLSTIVLSQLTSKGAPCIYGSSTTIMDMRKTTAPVGSPELGMISASVAKLAQFYNLPSFVAGG